MEIRSEMKKFHPSRPQVSTKLLSTLSLKTTENSQEFGSHPQGLLCAHSSLLTPVRKHTLFADRPALPRGGRLERDECDAFDGFPIVSSSGPLPPVRLTRSVLAAHRCLPKATVCASFGLRYSSALVSLCFGMDP